MKHNFPLFLGVVSLVSLVVLGIGCQEVWVAPLPARATAPPQATVSATQQGEGTDTPTPVSATQQGEGTDTPTPVSATQQGEGTDTPTPVPTSVPSDNSFVLTMEDNGKHISVKQDNMITLALDTTSFYDWTTSVSDPTVLISISSAPSSSHTQGIYRASKVGQTTIAADGEPKCRKSIPQCGAPSVHFAVQVSVV
jgi:hypothetical protein